VGSGRARWGKVASKEARLQRPSDVLTWSDPGSGDSRGVDSRNDPRLHPALTSVEAHCRQWHSVFRRHSEGTPYTQAMLTLDAEGCDTTPGRLDYRAAIRHRRLHDSPG
jgi:hypothetical protein